MNRLGLFTGSGVVGAALVPLLVVVMAFATGGDIFSAGSLNADQGPAPIGGAWSHAELACSDCHAPFWSASVMGDRCLDCHTEIGEQLATPTSLHAGIASPETCRQCHPEHQGSHASLTLYAPDLYPHAEFGFYLIGHLSHADGR
ncbi:MAG: cytochrome c3 family protein, partial [Anaerolineales bacterium]|nr:cytochrome c3 family protein [Anaerolineales bacterium]